MELTKFSRKQKQVMSWWMQERFSKHNGIIAEGSIRSGKTFSMIISYISWAMETVNNQTLAICGKTQLSLQRNVYRVFKPMLELLGYTYTEKLTEHLIIINKGDKQNYFYLFAGNDERSQDLIQGITLAGVYFDEVALMPESFVNQATGRCSVKGSKYWFNCNPEGPNHYFKTEWIDKSEEKKLITLHFTMDDNLSLDEDIKNRYKSQYTGVFYQRYILGQWALAEGIIYSMFDDNNIYTKETRIKGLEYLGTRTIACDYGTHNPCVFLDIYDLGDKIYIDNCYYYDGRANQKEKTDSQYADDMKAFMGDRYCDIVVDPSASSFIAELRQRGNVVREANNEVLDGIRVVSSLVAKKKILVNKDKCIEMIKEFQSYVWDDKAIQRGEEKPVKANDHTLDALRYFCKTILKGWRISLE